MLPIVAGVLTALGRGAGASLASKISGLFGNDNSSPSQSELEQRRTLSESSNAVMAQFDRAKQLIPDQTSPEFIEIYNAVAHEANTPNNFVWDVSGITALVDRNTKIYQERTGTSSGLTTDKSAEKIFANLSELMVISDFIKSTQAQNATVQSNTPVVQAQAVQTKDYTPYILGCIAIVGIVLLFKGR